MKKTITKLVLISCLILPTVYAGEHFLCSYSMSDYDGSEEISAESNIRIEPVQNASQEIILMEEDGLKLSILPDIKDPTYSLKKLKTNGTYREAKAKSKSHTSRNKNYVNHFYYKKLYLYVICKRRHDKNIKSETKIVKDISKIIVAIGDCQKEFAQVMDRASVVHDIIVTDEKESNEYGDLVSMRRTIKLKTGSFNGWNPAKDLGLLTMTSTLIDESRACDSGRCSEYQCKVEMYNK